MGEVRNAKLVKILRAFYTYHPDFSCDGEGSYTILPTGRYIAEWIVKEFREPEIKHYTKVFQSEVEARDFIEDMCQKYGEYCEYKTVPLQDDMFTAGKLTTILDQRKTPWN